MRRFTDEPFIGKCCTAPMSPVYLINDEFPAADIAHKLNGVPVSESKLR